uniref:ABC-2 type transporter transmembrane domain-containing protein n=1 Tax=Nelumbo nucifera TaxID=4432 RepID=A0A822ZLN4_NELNU|nr:TPA_asm: hypothetical protein HUJ06_003893 [Nelumbo nucifera]
MDAAHFWRVSVEETLMYNACLRGCGGRSVAVARVRELLKELGLDHVKDSRIGRDSARGISGGEKRKVSGLQRLWVYKPHRLLKANSLVAGVVLGTIFMNTRLGFFAFNLTFLLSSATKGLLIFLTERRILMREASRGAYRVSSYVTANTLVFLPFLLLFALLYNVPIYWLRGLRREIDEFLYFCLVVWTMVLMSNSFVACVSALLPSENGTASRILGGAIIF